MSYDNIKVKPSQLMSKHLKPAIERLCMQPFHKDTLSDVSFITRHVKNIQGGIFNTHMKIMDECIDSDLYEEKQQLIPKKGKEDKWKEYCERSDSEEIEIKREKLDFLKLHEQGLRLSRNDIDALSFMLCGFEE